MNNLKVVEDVRWAVWWAVTGAVWRAADEAVTGVVTGVVYGAEVRVVDNAVYWAMGDAEHPALQDFLRGTDPQ